MSLIKYQKKDHIAVLILNNPDQLNAMSLEMAKEFRKILNRIRKNKEIHVVILTGAGRAFSSGGNLKMLAKMARQSSQKTQRELMQFYKSFLMVREIPQPVIAMINGPAVGAGFCLAMACDLKYAIPKTKLGANFARIGLAPGMAGTYLLAHSCESARASEILLTGKIFTSEEALDYDLINKIFPKQKLEQNVRGIAREIANNSPRAVQEIKKGLQLARHKTLSQMLVHDSKVQTQSLKSKDFLQLIKE